MTKIIESCCYYFSCLKEDNQHPGLTQIKINKGKGAGLSRISSYSTYSPKNKMQKDDTDNYELLCKMEIQGFSCHRWYSADSY